MTEGALAYPMTNMSTLPSETFGPNREVMSSGGTAEPTFHVTMYTLWEIRNSSSATCWILGVKGGVICAAVELLSAVCVL